MWLLYQAAGIYPGESSRRHYGGVVQTRKGETSIQALLRREAEHKQNSVKAAQWLRDCCFIKLKLLQVFDDVKAAYRAELQLVLKLYTVKTIKF
jgi:hypothetical protein